MLKAATRSKPRWTGDGTYILGGSIVGTISQSGANWFAYGCLDEWNDVQLGSFGRQILAMRAVEDWVKSHE